MIRLSIFAYLLTILVSSFVKCLFATCSPYLFICLFCMWIIWLQMPSPSLWCSLQLYYNVLINKYFIVDEFFQTFPLCSAFLYFSWPWSNQDILCFFPKIFKVWLFIFRSLILMEFIVCIWWSVGVQFHFFSLLLTHFLSIICQTVHYTSSSSGPTCTASSDIAMFTCMWVCIWLLCLMPHLYLGWYQAVLFFVLFFWSIMTIQHLWLYGCSL